MLTGKQKRFLRGLGHTLTPVVMLGKEGASEAVERKISQELENHELIKVRVLDTCETSARVLAPTLAEHTGGELVQVLGHTFLLYRRRRKDPRITLPKADAPRPAGAA